MESIKKVWRKLKLNHYNDSLDFPCDFCNSNSYDNYHLFENDKIKFVVCKDCLKKSEKGSYN